MADKVRRDKEHNHELIYEAYIKLATSNKKIPKLTDLAKETGLSVKTIDRHLKTLNFEEQKEKMRLFTEAALFQLAKQAMSGKSVSWSSLFFEVVEGIGQKGASVKNTIINGDTDVTVTVEYND
jgi:hypothetical protein